MTWAFGMTEYVNAHSDLDVTLWSGTFGYPVGTLAWSSIVESQVALAESTSTLLADDGYFDLIEQAEGMITTPPQDILRELVFGEPSDPPPIGAVATITTATALVDRMADAIGWGVEIAQYVAEATATPVAMLTNVFGQMGEVAWIAVQPDLAAAETARTKLAGDADYLARLAPTKDLFVPASGHIAQVTRLG
jgi:hypothetical protein